MERLCHGTTRTAALPYVTPPPSRWRYDAGLLLVVLFWGLNFAVIKFPLAAMHPLTVNMFRFAASVLVVGALYARSAGGAFWRPLRAHGAALVGLALLGHVGYQVFFIFGIDLTTAGSASLLLASSPMWTAAFSHLARLERLRPGAWAGFALSLAGAAAVVVGGGGLARADASLAGDLLILASAVFWALYTVLSRPLLQRGVSATGLTFFSILLAFPVLLGLGLWTLPETDWPAVGAVDWAALVYSGALSTGVAYALWNVGVRHVGPAQTAAYGYLVPLVAVLGGVVLLGERVSGAQLLGGALIIAGLFVIRRFRTPSAPPAPAEAPPVEPAAFEAATRPGSRT